MYITSPDADIAWQFRLHARIVAIHQAPLDAGKKQQVEEQRNRHVRAVVKNRCVANLSRGYGPRHQRCWIRYPDHAEQQEEIGRHQHIVGVLDVREQAMVVDPHDADEKKAEQEAGVTRPLLRDSLPESQPFRRRLQFEDQQRCGD